MRSLAVVVAALTLVSAGASAADAKPKARKAAKVATKQPGETKRRSTEAKHGTTAKGRETPKRRDGEKHVTKHAKHARVASPAERAVKPERGRKPAKQTKKKKWAPPASLGPASGQSVGLPWYGRLQDPAALPESPRYVIRRPGRAFGTKPTVDITKAVLDSILDDFPEAHALAVGDMSALRGGQITQHRSHQSGRDLDLGLFYKAKPASYPSDFVSATADTIDFMTTFSMLDAFADSAGVDGGVAVMFLDYRLQGLLYEWAKEHAVEVEHLDKLFQYPHGKGAAHGLIRHEPNHDNHVHIRFKCPASDSGCKG